MASGSKSPGIRAFPNFCIICKIIAIAGYKCIKCDSVTHKRCVMQLKNVLVLSNDRINCCDDEDSIRDKDCPLYDADEAFTNSEKKIIKKLKLQAGKSMDVEHESDNSMSPVRDGILSNSESFDFQYTGIENTLNRLALNPLNQQPRQVQTGSSKTPIISSLFRDRPSQQTIISYKPFIKDRNVPPIVKKTCKGFKRCRGSDFSLLCNPNSWPQQGYGSSTAYGSIKWAMENSNVNPDLIGDLTTTYILPYTEGRNQDLKIISPETLQHLIRGMYKERIRSFAVIDCRYPYEFEGGHVAEAVNMYTREQVIELLKHQPHHADMIKRAILVLYCDISGDRAPIQYRHLRWLDRKMHESNYPFLHFPEIYILGGGYKSFFEQYPEMCTPMAYIEMTNPHHTDDFKQFRNMLMPRKYSYRITSPIVRSVKALW